MDHLIKHQVFDLQLDRQLDPFGIQQRISDRFRIDILPEMEKLFDQFSHIDETIEIDTLRVDLGNITPEMIDNGEWALIIEKVMRSGLEDAIENVEQGIKTRVEPSFQNSFNKWYFFIEHGYLPWNAGKPSAQWLQQVLESLVHSYENANKLRNLLKTNSTVAKRIAIYHTPIFISHIVELIGAHKQSSLPGVITALSAGMRSLKKTQISVDNISSQELEWQLWAEVLQRSAEKKSGLDTESLTEYLLKSVLRLTGENLVQLSNTFPPGGNGGALQSVIDSLLKRSTRENTSGEKNDPQKKPGTGNADERSLKSEADIIQSAARFVIQKEGREEMWQPGAGSTPTQGKLIEEGSATADQLLLMEEGMYVHLAGLVLLHPFFHNFFKKLNIVENGSFRDTRSQERAICILNEIASPSVIHLEHELVLAKFLCGWPLHLPVQTINEFSKMETEEMEGLLLAAIAQWEILKNTSPGVLQETFLQREGKLFYKNDKWYLQVEKKPVDILLRHLPWTISMIKLPWMKELLRVEWL